VIDYAAAADLLEAYVAAWTAYDGDAWVALFSEDAEYHEDPFGDALVGPNALRAWLLDAAESQRDLDITVERHWVSGSTVLAAWHASWTRRRDGDFVRVAAFLTADVAPDGRISRFRQWASYAPGSAG
jgi:ketosteroid isomerase-like protein